MSWVTVIWSMCAAACLTLALVHFSVWVRKRDEWASLFFTLTAMSTAAMALVEVAIMRAETPSAMTLIFRWGNVVVWVLFVSLVGFVRVYLQGGNRWLAWAAVGVRTLALGANFLTGENLNYREITGLQHIHWLGDTVAIADGSPNPWVLLGQLSILLLEIFVISAALQAWRRGERRRALSVGGSITFFVLACALVSILIFWGKVAWPVTITPFFVGIVATMGYELSREILRAARLAGELRESEQRMTLAAEAAELGLYVREFTSGKIWATDRLREWFGFTPAEPLDFEGWLQRVHVEDREAVRRAWNSGVVGDGRFEVEYRVMVPERPMRWIASRGRVEFDGNAQPVRLRDVARDITQRKQAEADAQQHRTALAHLMRVATLGELSSALAHELNQPLAAILSNAQAAQRFLAQDSWDPAEIREILQDIVADDQRAGEVIQRLRLLLKKGEFQPQVLSVNEVILDALKLLRFDLSTRGVVVVTELAAGLPAVRADSVQLQQVLLNLMMNAADAMAASPASTRTLTLRTQSGADSTLQISVADNGCGLPPGREEEVFTPYHTTKAQGLGLGLGLSRSIITAHGGRLWGENRPGGGAIFNFVLPTCENEVP